MFTGRVVVRLRVDVFIDLKRGGNQQFKPSLLWKYYRSRLQKFVNQCDVVFSAQR
jgi:hypothetical protein